MGHDNRKRRLLCGLLALIAVVVLALIVYRRLDPPGGWVYLDSAGLEWLGIGFMDGLEPVGSFEELFSRVQLYAPDLVSSPGDANPFGERFVGKYLSRVWQLPEGAERSNVPLLWIEEPDWGGDVHVLFYDGSKRLVKPDVLEQLLQRWTTPDIVYRPGIPGDTGPGDGIGRGPAKLTYPDARPDAEAADD